MFDVNENSLRDAKILMVDDEQLNMEVIITHLEDAGYANFVTTTDSVNAFDFICSEQPDIVLLDLIMPDVNGFEILSQLREEEETKHLPVIVLTSSNDSTTKLKVLQIGATDFLSKPVDASELALRLRNTLAARQYQNQLLNYDSLTGLPSRQLFDSTLTKVFERSIERELTSALLLLNVKRFTVVNDSYGRDVGDAMIKSVSARLSTVFSVGALKTTEVDTLSNQVFRIGGDQFAVIVPGLRDTNSFTELVEKMVAELSLPFPIEQDDVFLTFGIGISVCKQDLENTEDMITHAESALRRSDENPETSYLFYNQEMDKSAREYMQIETALRSALPEKQLFLVYQPKVDVQTDVIVGAEALIRWNHPELGIVSPDLFISLAEKTGLIVDIGRWVMEQACIQLTKWRDVGETEFKIAVNVSVRQLVDPSFVSTVSEIIDSTGIDPATLQLELTENMIMENPESAVEILNRLKDLGVMLSVDDFGTGYSSLMYLQKFPIDELKIDKSFIDEIQGPLDKAPIVKTVISLGHDLDLKLVAEGVETIHQLARLRALKCQIYQGYFCSPPIGISEFETLVEKRRNANKKNMVELKKAS